MSNNTERLQRALVADNIATQRLTPEEKGFLARFNEELDRLEKTPAFCDEMEEMINEAFRLVPGAERALNKHTKILDSLLKTGSR